MHKYAYFQEILQCNGQLTFICNIISLNLSGEKIAIKLKSYREEKVEILTLNWYMYQEVILEGLRFL